MSSPGHATPTLLPSGRQGRTHPSGTDGCWELCILACSRAKDDNHIAMPAIQRYDGPTFRTLRANLTQLPGVVVPAGAPPWLQIYIVSGRYGLVWYNQQVPWYDQKMSAVTASKLSLSVLPQLVELKASDGVPRHLIFTGPGAPYGQMLANIGRLFEGAEVTMNINRIGIQCKLLKQWLLARGKEHQQYAQDTSQGS